MTEANRYPLIDVLRFIAIFLMICFHFFYDLDIFNYVRIDFQENLFWYMLPRLIVTLFLICVGAGLSISHSKEVHWGNVKKRFLKIFSLALGVSVVTYFMFPQTWIIFGTLHCIAISSVLGVFFLRRKNLSLGVILALFILEIIFPEKWINISGYFKVKSMDYIPLTPWFAFVLIGIRVEEQGWFKYSMPSWTCAPFIRWTSKHSLKIYITHQPLLFGCLYMIEKLTS